MPSTAPAVVVMGVSGSGKTTVGRALAVRIDARFIDADDLHPEENVARLRTGIPLTDADRAPWLARVAAEVAATPGAVVVACSALRRRYRDALRLGAGRPLAFVQLSGAAELLAERLAARAGHFMSPSLLESQLATLEPLEADELGIVLEIADGLEALVEAAERVARERGQRAD